MESWQLRYSTGMRKKYLMDNDTYEKIKDILAEYMELDEYNKVPVY